MESTGSIKRAEGMESRRNVEVKLVLEVVIERRRKKREKEKRERKERKKE